MRATTSALLAAAAALAGAPAALASRIPGPALPRKPSSSATQKCLSTGRLGACPELDFIPCGGGLAGTVGGEEILDRLRLHPSV